MTATPTTATMRGRRRSGADRGPLLSTAFVLIAGLIIAGGSADSYFGSVVILALTTRSSPPAWRCRSASASRSSSASRCSWASARTASRCSTQTSAGRACSRSLPSRSRAAAVAWVIGKAVSRASGLALAVATLMFPLIAFGYVSSRTGSAARRPSLTGTLWPGGSATANANRGASRRHRRNRRVRHDAICRVRHRARDVHARREREHRQRNGGAHLAPAPRAVHPRLRAGHARRGRLRRDPAVRAARRSCGPTSELRC